MLNPLYINKYLNTIYDYVKDLHKTIQTHASIQDKFIAHVAIQIKHKRYTYLLPVSVWTICSKMASGQTIDAIGKPFRRRVTIRA